MSRSKTLGIVGNLDCESLVAAPPFRGRHCLAASLQKGGSFIPKLDKGSLTTGRHALRSLRGHTRLPTLPRIATDLDRNMVELITSCLNFSFSTASIS